jgi:hypothetical protein
MVPLRKVDGQGFAAPKERAPKGEYPAKAWRAELLCAKMGEYGQPAQGTARIEVRIDHRRLARIDREPEPQKGRLAAQIERQGRKAWPGRPIGKCSPQHRACTVEAEPAEIDDEEKREDASRQKRAIARRSTRLDEPRRTSALDLDLVVIGRPPAAPNGGATGAWPVGHGHAAPRPLGEGTPNVGCARNIPPPSPASAQRFLRRR